MSAKKDINFIALVQARTGSSRFPGKVLKKVHGKPILTHLVERIRCANTVDGVVVITSDLRRDDAIERLCKKEGISCFRGSEEDLLDRHYQAAKKFNAHFIIKIPSDCPLADPHIIDTVIGLWKNNPNKYDYVSNYHSPTFPDGLDVEGFPFEVLETAWREAKEPHEREHATPYIWDQPDKFRIGNVENPRGNMFMTHRWTLDYPEDWEFIKAVYEEFGGDIHFSADDVFDLIERKPEIANKNAKYNGVNWYRTVGAEKLKTVTEDQYRQEPE